MIPRLATVVLASSALLLAARAHGEEAQASSTSAEPAAEASLEASTDSLDLDLAMTLGIEADLGVAHRLGKNDSGYIDDERAGALVGGGVFFSPMPLFDLGLSYQRTQLGAEIAPPGDVLAANSLARSLNSVWANVRTYPWRSEKVGLFVGLMFGPTWESTSGHVTYPPSGIAGVMQSYSCSASGPAALALGVTAGADFDLGGGLALLTRLTGASYHVSSELLTDSDGRICGPGAGSAATIDARLGIAYRFDLGPKRAAASLAAK